MSAVIAAAETPETVMVDVGSIPNVSPLSVNPVSTYKNPGDPVLPVGPVQQGPISPCLPCGPRGPCEPAGPRDPVAPDLSGTSASS